MPPLNTDDRGGFIDRLIGSIGGLELIIFDNVQALLAEDITWQQALPWIRDLTRLKSARCRFHRIGYDESHGYATMSREWQLDVVSARAVVLLHGDDRSCDVLDGDPA